VFEGKCLITGIDEKEILVASHIKPWSKCSNEERLDENNGLLLVPNYDKLFDIGLITFGEKGELLISNVLSEENIKKLSLRSTNFHDIVLENEDRKRYLK